MRKTHPIVLFVTWFGSGLSPKAPGTMGSLAAMPVVYLFHEHGSMIWLMYLSLALFLFGTLASDRYMAQTGKDGDPKEIVIDEVVGIWFMFAGMPAMSLPVSYEYQLEFLVGGFIAFRFFDIVKPWPISLADQKLKGGFGVMVDDILAALAAILAIGFMRFVFQ